MKGTYRRLALSVFLLLALCLPEVQAFSEAAPSDIVSWVSGHYEAQEIAAYAEDGSTCAIAVRNESAYTLVLLRREDGKLITDIENTKALKAGSAPLLSLKNSGNELSIAYEDRYNNEITSSVTYSASRASGGIWSVTDIKYRWNQELNEYNVMLGKGNIAIEYTLWDKDGSVLSKAAFPKLPAVWLSGYKALTDFNCALFAEAPLNSDIYAESALAPCILEFSDDIVSVEAASLGTTGVFSTCKMRDETRRAVIIEIGEGGGAVLTQSLPLPDAISLDTFHSWSSMQLYINGEGDSVGIRRQADGSWAVVNIMADEVIQLGANYIKLQGAENNRCLFGSSPWSDFRTLDFKTIPKSQAEAENAFETDGWAVVNNPKLMVLIVIDNN